MANRSIGFLIQNGKNIPPKYKRDSGLTTEIKNIISDTLKNRQSIPNVVDGYKQFDGEKRYQTSPNHNLNKICEFTLTSEETLDKYLNNYQYYKQNIFGLSNSDRAHIFKKATYLLNNKYREQMLAYTILGQGKSLYEAEIDSICELSDFLVFNQNYAREITNRQPISTPGIKNTSRYNPLHGFVASITPFNFTAIGGNLASVPTLFGNSVIWKPSDKSILSNYLFYNIMLEAGMPKEAIAFCPCDPALFNKKILASPHLGSLLFTGSSIVFQSLCHDIYSNIKHYNTFPRLVGETGGKNFHFIHPEIEDIEYVVQKTIESAYDYGGQKCSACSIVFVPKSLHEDFMSSFNKKIKLFKESSWYKYYSVIDSRSYFSSVNMLQSFNGSSEYEILSGGDYKQDNGKYFIEPTLIKSDDPNSSLFKQEFFAPILGVYVYDDMSFEQVNEALHVCKNQNMYGLTGSIFSNNQLFIDYGTEILKEKCGNFYINDKSTGSVVGQQPFGGGMRSGTNDKAGDINMLYRLFNQQNIKENINSKK